MPKLSPYELAAGVFFFQIGSSPLFLLAKSAHRDAWLSVIAGLLAGLLMLAAILLPMFRREPGKSLIELLSGYMGRWFGGAVAASYVLYFSYQSVRNVREFGDWMLSYLLPNTPLFFVTLVLMLVSAFAVYKGPEAFFRLALLICPFIVLMYGLLLIPIFASELFQYERLLPVMENGLKPVAGAVLPVFSFPFGEMVLCLMFWKYAKAVRATTRMTLAAFLSAGLMIVSANVLLLGVLGPIADFTLIPLLETVSLYAAAERMDPIVLLLLFVGVFMKQTAYFLAAVLSLSQLTGWKERYALLPVGALIYVGALAFRSYMQHVWVGFRLNLPYHFPIFEAVLPILLFIFMMIRSPKTSTMGESR